MNELEQYLTDELDKFNKTYDARYHVSRYMDKDLQRRWKKDQKSIDQYWQSIKSIDDVQRSVNIFIGTVESFENVSRGFIEDAYNMDLALYKAVTAIHKMKQCYDMANDFDFYQFGKDDIDQMFETLYSGLKRMEKVNMNRAYQD